MKTSRLRKKSSAITRSKTMKDRRREGLCVICGGPMVETMTSVGIILPFNGECGACRWQMMRMARYEDD
jgi:hypothetical protein